MNVRLVADNAGTVRKKFGKTSFCDSSPEAADGETCGKEKNNEKQNKKFLCVILRVNFLWSPT